MGEEIRVTCSGCRVNRRQSVGVGMMGRGTELCACYACKKFVVRKIEMWGSHFDEPPIELKSTCKSCGGDIVPVHPRIIDEWTLDDEEDENEELNRECPRCGGELRGRFTGLMWD